MRVLMILIWMTAGIVTSPSQILSKNNRNFHRFSRRSSHRSSDDKIVGGRIVRNMTEYPYMVSVAIDGHHSCGGSLLTTTFVVTACHCVAELSINEPGPAKPLGHLSVKAYSFIAGTANIMMYESTVQVGKAQSLHYHPKCENRNSFMMNDIGLARMHKPFTKTPYVQPIKMYTWDKEDFQEHLVRMFNTADNPKCGVAGWGDTRRGDYKYSVASDFLKTVHMHVISGEDCLKTYTEMFPGRFEGLNFTENGQICLVSDNLDSSDCSGDSGGPYVCDGYMIGVVSYGTKCGTEDPSVYQTASVLIDWCRAEFSGEIYMSDSSTPNQPGEMMLHLSMKTRRKLDTKRDQGGTNSRASYQENELHTAFLVITFQVVRYFMNEK